jgi:hypothetical protein
MTDRMNQSVAQQPSPNDPDDVQYRMLRPETLDRIRDGLVRYAHTHQRPDIKVRMLTWAAAEDQGWYVDGEQAESRHVPPGATSSVYVLERRDDHRRPDLPFALTLFHIDAELGCPVNETYLSEYPDAAAAKEAAEGFEQDPFGCGHDPAWNWPHHTLTTAGDVYGSEVCAIEGTPFDTCPLAETPTFESPIPRRLVWWSPGPDDDTPEIQTANSRHVPADAASSMYQIERDDFEPGIGPDHPNRWHVALVHLDEEGDTIGETVIGHRQGETAAKAAAERFECEGVVL